MKKILLLKSIRQDFQFFWSRLFIGFILAISVHYSKVVDTAQLIHEIRDKQILLVITLFVLLFLMVMLGKFKVLKLHNNCLYLCKTITALIKSIIIMGIAALVLCIVVDGDLSFVLTCLTFIYTLELVTRLSFEWERFERKNRSRPPKKLNLCKNNQG